MVLQSYAKTYRGMSQASSPTNPLQRLPLGRRHEVTVGEASLPRNAPPEICPIIAA